MTNYEQEFVPKYQSHEEQIKVFRKDIDDIKEEIAALKKKVDSLERDRTGDMKDLLKEIMGDILAKVKAHVEECFFQRDKAQSAAELEVFEVQTIHENMSSLLIDIGRMATKAKNAQASSRSLPKHHVDEILSAKKMISEWRIGQAQIVSRVKKHRDFIKDQKEKGNEIVDVKVLDGLEEFITSFEDVRKRVAEHERTILAFEKEIVKTKEKS